MKISSISVTAWSTGSIAILLDSGDAVSIGLTEDETERFRQLATDIFFSRQKAIAKEIETAQPLMIELQPEHVEEASAVRLESVDPPAYKDLDDDIPF